MAMCVGDERVDERQVLSSKVVVGETKYGFGLFAHEDICEGEMVCCDLRTPGEGGDRLYSRKEIMQWDDIREREALKNFSYMHGEDEYASAFNASNDPTFFMNHSCDANLWYTETTPGAGWSSFALHARRFIAKGCELTYDYSTTETGGSFHAGTKCACGAASCRGSLVLGYRDPAWVKEYKNRVSPHVARLAISWARQNQAMLSK